MVIGIDLGNTNTSLSWFDPEASGGTGVSQLLPILDEVNKAVGLRHVLRTAVFFPEDGSDPVVGIPALTRQDEGALFTNFKRELMNAASDENLSAYELEGGARTVTAQDALSALLQALLRFAQGSTEIEYLFDSPDDMRIEPVGDIRLVVGVPAEVSDLYRNRLIRALVESGWLKSREQAARGDGALTLLAEPVAVLLNFKRVAEGSTYLIYDHGGQTLDVAVLRGEADGQVEVVGKYRADLHLDGRTLDVGGTVLDRLLLRDLYDEAGEELFREACAAFGRAGGGAPEADEMTSLLRVWTDPDSTVSPAARSLYRNLMLDAEYLRIRLSENAKSGRGREHVPLILNALSRYGVATDWTRDAEGFEAAISPALEAIRARLDEIAESHGNARCFLAGGVSQSPALAPLLQDVFGRARVLTPTDFSPLVAIAAGLSRHEPSRLADVLDCDYGVFNAGTNAYHPILKAGTRYDAATFNGNGVPHGAKSNVFVPQKPSLKVKVKVAWRRGGGQWEPMGIRSVTLPTAQTRFEVYFGVDPAQGRLEVRLMDANTRELIPVPDPYFATAGTNN